MLCLTVEREWRPVFVSRSTFGKVASRSTPSGTNLKPAPQPQSRSPDRTHRRPSLPTPISLITPPTTIHLLTPFLIPFPVLTPTRPAPPPSTPLLRLLPRTSSSEHRIVDTPFLVPPLTVVAFRSRPIAPKPFHQYKSGEFERRREGEGRGRGGGGEGEGVPT